MASGISKTQARPIRIGNASGASGDGIDQVYRLARDGDVDAITADYLAEFNIAWKAIELTTRPDLFYNGMQGYCGLHLSMDWRTMEPRPYVK